MIIGSGLLATAFLPFESEFPDVCFYAAGVSNSSCIDARDFQRDRMRLQETLAGLPSSTLIVYFSTCSVCDPWSRNNPYALHKARMEELVRERNCFFVARLPQVAGRTPNPHTLLNYLHSRIIRSERFDLWKNASRNIIDIDDVVQLVIDILRNERVDQETVNIANPHNILLTEIVAALEHIAAHDAIYDAIDRGGGYPIDTTRIASSIARCGIQFDAGYLPRVLAKYYA